MMETAWDKATMRRACLSLALVLTTVSLGETVGGAGQSGTPSILSRVQRESDPELSELIRIALANRQSDREQERFEIVRKVTHSYAQIKLLDQQIEQLDRKIEATAGPAEMRYELVLAQAELESKRTTELANLREAMGVIPRLPFEEQPKERLNAWVNLQLLDHRVAVLDGLKPFHNYWAMRRFESVGMLSEREALDYVQGRLKDKNSLPIRIEVSYTAEAGRGGQELRGKIMALAREMKAEMDTDVRSRLATWVGVGESPFFLQEGKITTVYPASVQAPEGGSKLLATGFVDPNDLEQSIIWRLTMPDNVPVRFRIEYDEASARLAKQVADTVRAVAKRLGLSELVEVTGVLTEMAPERAFLGRWQAIKQAEIQTIDIQRGICQVTIGKGTETLKAGTNTSGTWIPAGKEIYLDINDRDQDNYYLYSASINQQGYLVVNRGVIYPQGTFVPHGPSESIFQKVH